MITKDWSQAVDATHELFKASSDIVDESGNVLVTAYPIKRPDGSWSVMLVNRDQDHEHAVKLKFADAEAGRDGYLSGQVDQVVFGESQYQWHPGGSMGHTDPDGPPLRSTLNGSTDTLYRLPKASLTILRGNIRVK